MAKIIQTADLSPSTPLTKDEKLWVYNGLDCCVTMEVLDAIEPQLDEVTRPTYEFSLALQAPVLEMTTRGILVDQMKRRKAVADFQSKIDRLEAQFNKLLIDGIGLPATMNWASPAQMMKLFYDVLGLPVKRKRNTKGLYAPTIDRDALEGLEVYFIAQPLVKHVLALRDTWKKKDFLEKGIDPDGRMRTSLNIAGTNSGRLASSMSDFGTGDNMQNIDKELRYPFVADPGYVFVNLDLEQGDARNVGALCWQLFYESHGEDYAGAYLDACESGDLHTAVCRMAWMDLDWGDDPSHWRSVADRIAYRWLSYRDLSKKLGHGTNYYGTPPTMAKHTKVEKLIIEEFQRKYFAAFPCIKSYHEWVRAQLRDKGFITTLFGRQRFFFGRENEDTTLREAIAYAPQSMTADAIDGGILQIFRARDTMSSDIQLLMQVHDSLLMQVPERDVERLVPWALETLKRPLTLVGDRRFVLPTEAKVGYNWGDVSEGNPDGLAKWKGGWDRKRLEPVSRQLTIRGL